MTRILFSLMLHCALGAGAKTANDGRVFSGYWQHGCFGQGDDLSVIGKTQAECGL
jgi:hypothetical protein